jgi:hypothetical protein
MDITPPDMRTSNRVCEGEFSHYPLRKGNGNVEGYWVWAFSGNCCVSCNLLGFFKAVCALARFIRCYPCGVTHEHTPPPLSATCYTGSSATSVGHDRGAQPLPTRCKVYEPRQKRLLMNILSPVTWVLAVLLAIPAAAHASRCCRSWTSWCTRSPKWQPSCRPRNRAVRR